MRASRAQGCRTQRSTEGDRSRQYPGARIFDEWFVTVAGAASGDRVAFPSATLRRSASLASQWPDACAMTSDPLRRALIDRAVDRLPPESLPDVATGALMHGYDSPSLRELAGAPVDDHEANRPLLAAAVSKIGLEIPSQSAAHWFLVRELATQILDGSIDPYAGARRIWAEHWHEMNRPDELADFVALTSDWEDLGQTGPLGVPDLRALLERQIAAASRVLLETRQQG